MRVVNAMNCRTRTIGDKHYNRVWCMLHVTYKSYWHNYACHNFIDRPIELICYKSTRHPKCCIKPLQSLFCARPQKHALLVAQGITARTSFSQSYLHTHLLCNLPYRFSRKRETTHRLLSFCCHNNSKIKVTMHLFKFITFKRIHIGQTIRWLWVNIHI